MIVETVVNMLLHNHNNCDPEWRFQAGCLADLLEAGSSMPSEVALFSLQRVSRQRFETRKQLINWGRSQENALN